MVPSLWTITRTQKETADTFTMELKPPPECADYRFAAGQFNMLWIFGVGEVPISISSDPTVEGRLEHTTRAVGAVTKAMKKLRRGDVIGVRGPVGTTWPVAACEGKDVVLVAGGIGLAPLRPVILQLLGMRDKVGRLVLLFGARTPSDILFERELRDWSASFDIEVHVTVDRAEGGWHGNVGVVPNLIRRAPFDPANTIAMACGPEIMIRYSVREFKDRGLSEDDIYVSLERNMKCAVGLCGHCQMGAELICRDGPVYPHSRVGKLLEVREI